MEHMTTSCNGRRLQGRESGQALTVCGLSSVLVPVIRFAGLDQQDRGGDLAPTRQNLLDPIQHRVTTPMGGVTPKLPTGGGRIPIGRIGSGRLPRRHIDGLGPVLGEPRRPVGPKAGVVAEHP